VWFVVPFGQHSLVGTTEVELPSPPPPGAAAPDVREVAYLRAELAHALPGAAGVEPRAAFAGIRPLLAGRGAIGSASREHRVVADGAVLTLAGGKLTTFRAMARDTVRAALARLGRHERELRESDDPLPPPVAPGLPLDLVVDFALDAELARRAVDVVRRRTTLWLEPARARAAAPRIVARMAARLGWDDVRALEETDAVMTCCDDLERPLATRPEEA
jgi:glycerol-3-phosphate dehydrogenase